MGFQVTFDYAGFVATFPELANVDQATVSAWFSVSGSTVCRNDGLGPVNNLATATTLMNFATAHLIALFASQVNGQPNTTSASAVPSPNLVGRIQSATEGSVTVNTEMPQPPSGTAAWWMQTKYGAFWWQATAPYRTMRYIPGPRRFFGPVFGAGAWGAGFGNPLAVSCFTGLNGAVIF